MLRLLVFCCLVLGLSAFEDRVWGETDPKMGRNCNAGESGKAEIKWYFDWNHNTVYPFKYLGCGETNGYDFNGARRNAPMDRQICPGFFKPTGHCSGSRGLEFWPPRATVEPPQVCKAGEYCMSYVMGNGGGPCCNSDIKARYEENGKAKCPSGSTAVLNENYQDWRITLFGKKCSHEFCPTGTQCIDGEFQAYCCKKQ